MSVPRLVFSLVSLAIVFLTYRVALLSCGSRLKSLFCTLLLISTSIYLQRSFRIRSDILVTLIYLINFYLQYRLTGKWLKLSLGFLLGIVALGVTPKSILLFIAFLPFLFRDVSLLTILNREWKKTLVVIPLIFLLFYGSDYWVSITKSFTYFMNTFGTEEVGARYWTRIRFHYILKLFLENIHLCLLFVSSLTYSLIYIKKPDRLSWFFIILGVCFFFYPNRHPFYIASLLPFLCLYLARSRLLGVIFSFPKQWLLHKVLVLSTLFLVFHGFRYIIHIFNYNTNHLQLVTSQEVEKYLSHLPSGYKIYDPVGVAPNFDSFNWFVGPGEKNKYIVNRIEETGIHIILYTHKLFFLEPELSQMLKRNFISIAPGVFTRSIGFNTDEEMFNNGLSRKRVRDLLSHRYKDFYRDENVYMAGYSLRGTLVELQFKIGEDRVKIPKDITHIKATVFGGNPPKLLDDLRKTYTFDANL